MKALDWNVGASTSFFGGGLDGKVLDRRLFEAYQESNISSLEISMGWEKYERIDYAETYRLSKEYGIELRSFHLPFCPFECNNIASLDHDIRKETIRIQTELIQKLADIGIKIAVIHPSGEPISSEERPEMMKRSQESLRTLAEAASKCDVTVAVENIPRTCLGKDSQEMLELLSVDDRLRVCFDTNHLLDESYTDFIRRVGDKIITTHFSDYDFLNERHWLPGEGRVNWGKLVTALEDVGYNGPINYEVSQKAPKTISRRDLTLSDLFENYQSLIQKQPPKTFGSINLEATHELAFYAKPMIEI